MNKLKFRKAIESDLDLYYHWANDDLVRRQSFNENKVSYENHVRWFTEKINHLDFYFYLYQNENDDYVGQVRIQKTGLYEAIIGVSIDTSFRGLGYGVEMLTKAVIDFLSLNSTFKVHAYIKCNNISSKKIFEKAGFVLNDILEYNNYLSFHFIKYANR